MAIVEDLRKCPQCKTFVGGGDWSVRKTGPRTGSFLSCCKSCSREKFREKKKNNCKSQKDIERKSKLKSQYGISPEDYENMLLNQNKSCKICSSSDPRNSRTQRFAIDHCHETKNVRGLLCFKCNAGLGLFSDNPDTLRLAAFYLENS